MIESFFFSSQNYNVYLYNDKQMFTSLVHPQLKAVHENPSKADEYYNDKYKYLVEHGFFQNPYIVELGSVDQQMIEREISKVPEILFEVTDSCNLKCTSNPQLRA